MSELAMKILLINEGVETFKVKLWTLTEQVVLTTLLIWKFVGSKNFFKYVRTSDENSPY